MMRGRAETEIKFRMTDKGSHCNNGILNKGTETDGFLWKLREVLHKEDFWEEDIKSCSDEKEENKSDVEETSTYSTVDLGTDNTDYSQEIPGGMQDELTRVMCCLRIRDVKNDARDNLGLESELDPTIWKFVKLLSEKLDKESIPNLFGTKPRPTANLLVRMLECHKLRSTYDFEQAIAREWHLNNELSAHNENAVTGKSKVGWNFRILDLAAGVGTTVDTVFALKERGVFRGAKRRLDFKGVDVNLKPSKCGKLEEVGELFECLNLTNKSGTNIKNK